MHGSLSKTSGECTREAILKYLLVDRMYSNVVVAFDIGLGVLRDGRTAVKEDSMRLICSIAQANSNLTGLTTSCRGRAAINWHVQAQIGQILT
eukprot:11956509-Ditylum_brightwellii.AAC.1